MLLHLVDGTQDDVAATYKTVREELNAYGGGLDRKKEIVALNKCDALDEETQEKKRQALSEACRKKVYIHSGVSGHGRNEILRKTAIILEDTRVSESDFIGDRGEGSQAQGWSP